MLGTRDDISTCSRFDSISASDICCAVISVRLMPIRPKAVSVRLELAGPNEYVPVDVNPCPYPFSCWRTVIVTVPVPLLSKTRQNSGV